LAVTPLGVLVRHRPLVAVPGPVPICCCRARPDGGPDVVRRALVRAREEAIWVGLWVMVGCAAVGFSQLAAAIVHH
jgi:hypothetical protein